MCGYCGYCCKFIQHVYDVTVLQSDDVIRTDVIQSTVEQVNMEFNADENEIQISKTTTPMWYQPTISAKADIDKFLSRPVLVKTVNWSVGGSISNSFSPWKEFFEHPSIKKKIDNYAFVRCDLHVKVMINASPFYYGAALMSYKPLELEYDPAPITFAGDALVSRSQNPHFYIYPQNSEGGELICPFLSNTEWLDITNVTEVTNFGIFRYNSMDVLRNANSVGAGDITIQFYVWAENVTLAGLTVDLSLQSDDVKRSEYNNGGAISKPASAIARTTGLLSKVPVIGPYMTATSIAASSVSNIAALFGYTKVPVVDNVKPYKNLPFHGLAVSDISDATEKLSVDSKNELTVNNTCIGDPEADPLQISKFVQRSSYLTKFTWLSTDAADTLLWNTYINPFMSVVTPGTQQNIINGTPMWIAANMFHYWRGDIIYDFKIISSKYHRGRLRLSWDPVGDIANTADSSTEVYTHIVDISETTNISLRVPYMQRAAYLKTPSSLTSTIFDVSPLAKDSSDTVNGILTIRVLTEQTSPISSADVVVLVSVRGAENLEFAGPKSIDNDLGFYTVQSDDIPRTLQSDDIMNSVEEFTFGENSRVDDNLNLVYMGEKVSNFRELLQRSNHSLTWRTAVSTTAGIWHTIVMNRRPIFNGYDSNGVHSAVGLVSAVTEPYNFVTNTPYHLLSSCFLGERGSFTWKMNIDGYSPHSIEITRNKTNLTASNYKPTTNIVDLTNLTVNETAAHFANNSFSQSGALMINQRTNTGISANIPMYTQYTALETSPNYRTLGKSNVSGDDSFRISWVIKEGSHSEADDEFNHLWFNVGPDYSPYFFMNVPTLYLYNSTPQGV